MISSLVTRRPYLIASSRSTANDRGRKSWRSPASVGNSSRARSITKPGKRTEVASGVGKARFIHNFSFKKIFLRILSGLARTSSRIIPLRFHPLSEPAMTFITPANRRETPAEASSISDGFRRSGTCPAPRSEIQRPPLQVGGQSRTHQARPFDVRAIMEFPTPNEAQLRSLFGLTPSEARTRPASGLRRYRRRGRPGTRRQAHHRSQPACRDILQDRHPQAGEARRHIEPHRPSCGYGVMRSEVAPRR